MDGIADILQQSSSSLYLCPTSFSIPPTLLVWEFVLSHWFDCVVVQLAVRCVVDCTSWENPHFDSEKLAIVMRMWFLEYLLLIEITNSRQVVMYVSLSRSLWLSCLAILSKPLLLSMSAGLVVAQQFCIAYLDCKTRSMAVNLLFLFACWHCTPIVVWCCTVWLRLCWIALSS